MAKGENIFKRKDGRWEARYIKGHDLSGKSLYGFCYGRTYKQAKEKVTIAKAEALAGIGIAPASSHKRLSDYCEEWLISCKSKVKESTYVKYEEILRKHILRKLGCCLPWALTDALLESFTEELLLENRLAPKTVRDILMVLRSAIKYADKRYPGVFPSLDIPYPKAVSREIRVLSIEEQAQLVSVLLKDMDACRFGILLALMTGLRIGELCALRWERISLTEQTIHITETLQRLKDLSEAGSKTKLAMGVPKSGKSRRVIPMSEEVARLCRRMNPHCPTAYLLTGAPKFMEPRALQYRLRRITEECGLEGVHFHTLRHTFATRCVEAGFELKSLSEVLGHANTTITLNRYVHSSMSLKRDNMNKLSMLEDDPIAVKSNCHARQKEGKPLEP